MDPDDRRENAIGKLGLLRDALERHEAQRPDPDTLLPRAFADWFNQTLREVGGDLGHGLVDRHALGESAILRQDHTAGRPIAAVGRGTLLASVREALRDAGAE